MNATATRWLIESVFVRDILGFQGTRTFDFSPGLQVIEAPNHTGKSSFAMALLWALTGIVPTLDRLDNRSFRLTNKHAGSNAEPEVRVKLISSDSQTMEIRRKYVARGNRAEETVELTLGDMLLSGSEANDQILDTLGVQRGTLEGCGVVLQDLRLKLIQGTETDVSAAINDMLGLEALSEVVPSLQERANEAGRLEREIGNFLQGGDPIRLWEEEERRLKEVLAGRESEASEARFEDTDLEDAQELLSRELTAVATQLDVPLPRQGSDGVREVGRLRRICSIREGSG